VFSSSESHTVIDGCQGHIGAPMFWVTSLFYTQSGPKPIKILRKRLPRSAAPVSRQVWPPCSRIPGPPGPATPPAEMPPQPPCSPAEKRVWLAIGKSIGVGPDTGKIIILPEIYIFPQNRINLRPILNNFARSSLRQGCQDICFCKGRGLLPLFVPYRTGRGWRFIFNPVGYQLTYKHQ
jgi:hypothetical protein